MKKLYFVAGTCWTVSDYLSLNATREVLEKQLTLMRDAGINMIRVGGTMVYESDEFYELCDQLGLLVWQDFMFASMDYPITDDEFANNVKAEAAFQLRRLSSHACISIYCGNTDVEAQAAMYGMPQEIWHNQLFSEWLPQLCKQLHSQVPYIASSPTGGAMPFHLNSGVTHFWANGAYMLPTTDTNKTQVRFASEGMGLSHIPEDETIFQSIGKSTLFPYDNEWEKRIPRDLGAGWDFNDIRDSYLEELFNVNPVRLRRHNVDRYIELSRIVTGEVISRVFSYWRSFNSQCNGGLIWFNRDFWPCAGFGIIDSFNRPKAAYYQLKNVWSKQCVILQNEGLDGATITVVNESQTALNGLIEITLIKNASTLVSQAEQTISVGPNCKSYISVDQMLGRFYDTGYAYKFGTPQFDVIACRLLDPENNVISESFLFPETLALPKLDNVEVSAIGVVQSDGKICLTIKSNSFLQFVQINIKNFQAENNYFHLLPNNDKTILLVPVETDVKKFRGQLDAINLTQPIKIKFND